MIDTDINNRFMEFRMSDQKFAIPLLYVKEVISKPEITPMPNMQAHFEGMINLRGQIIGIYNIRKRLGAKSKDPADKNKDVIIVIEFENEYFGIIVDEITRVLTPSPEAIDSSPMKEEYPAAKYIDFIIKFEKELILTIRIEKLLDLERKQINKPMAA